MQDFALITTMDDEGNITTDLACDSLGNLSIFQDADCVEQMIVCALQLFLGEYEYNNALGISWKLALQGGYAQIPLLQYQIQNTITGLNNYIQEENLKIKDVSQVNTKFDENRNLSISANVTLANNTVIEVNTNV